MSVFFFHTLLAYILVQRINLYILILMSESTDIFIFEFNLLFHVIVYYCHFILYQFPNMKFCYFICIFYNDNGKISFSDNCSYELT
ncbi:hypothetical protein KUTeg_014129 [Tegillarca granosa]|uniref:NADH dehydrogenase subunit 4L n=1 Tax=Tegillarca granosa TaxID=220873 RepID=A0ABQ9F0W2_TEGGR|nr:hypothetical protein KUTeg_014129 [Tegillarca granosa]